jgi:hypothetical protein
LYTRSFNRFELKYVVHWSVADALRANVSAYVERDPHAGDQGLYRISSLYFDSPDLTCFWEKIEGIKYRRKLRLRTYGESGDSHAFVEIKQRIDRTVQKRRVRCPLEPAIEAMHEPQRMLQQLPTDPVISEALYLVDTMRLEPKMVVSYQREAYLGIYEDGLRITFDTSLRYSDRDLRLGRTSDNEKYFLAPDLVIVEIKFNERVPLWLCSHLNRLSMVGQRVSKYCAAVGLAYYGASPLEWRRVYGPAH